MLEIFNLYTYIFTFGGLFFVSMLIGLYLVFFKPAAMHNDMPRSSKEIRKSAGKMIIFGQGIIFVGGIMQLIFFNSPAYNIVSTYTVVVSTVVFIVMLVNWLCKLLQNRTEPLPVFLRALALVGMLLSVVYLIHDCLSGFILDIYTNKTSICILEIFIAVWSLFFIAFFTWYYRQATIYHRWLKENYSEIHDRSLRNLQSIAISSAILLFMIFAANFLEEDYWILNTMLPITGIVANLQVLYFTERISRNEIKKIEPDTEEIYTEPLSTELIEGEKDATRQGSSTDESLALINELLDKKLVEGKLYLNPDLTLDELAQHLHTNRSYVSRCFSNRGTTFYNFINNLRIQHAIELLKEDPTIKQADLALRCGYNYRQALTRNFQTVTGTSIIDYIKNLSE